MPGGAHNWVKPTGEIVGIAFTPDSSTLRVADKNGVITAWHPTGQVLESLACEGFHSKRCRPRPQA